MPLWSKTDKPKWLTTAQKLRTNLTPAGWVYTHENGTQEILVAAGGLYVPPTVIDGVYSISSPGNQVTTIGPTTLLSITRSSGSQARVIVYDNTIPPVGRSIFSKVMVSGEKVTLPTPIKMINGSYIEVYAYNETDPELITNGSFNTDVSGWTPQLTGATIDWVSPGNLRLISTTAGGRATQTVSGLVIGNTYTFTSTIVSVSGTVGNTASLRITTSADGSSTGQIYQSTALGVGSSGTFVTNFVATATSLTFAILAAPTLTVLADNASLKQYRPIDGTVDLEFSA